MSIIRLRDSTTKEILGYRVHGEKISYEIRMSGESHNRDFNWHCRGFVGLVKPRSKSSYITEEQPVGFDREDKFIFENDVIEYENITMFVEKDSFIDKRYSLRNSDKYNRKILRIFKRNF